MFKVLLIGEALYAVEHLLGHGILIGIKADGLGAQLGQRCGRRYAGEACGLVDALKFVVEFLAVSAG